MYISPLRSNPQLRRYRITSSGGASDKEWWSVTMAFGLRRCMLIAAEDDEELWNSPMSSLLAGFAADEMTLLGKLKCCDVWWKCRAHQPTESLPVKLNLRSSLLAGNIKYVLWLTSILRRTKTDFTGRRILRTHNITF